MKIRVESTGHVFSHLDVQVRLFTGETDKKVQVQAYVLRTESIERRYAAAFPKRLSLSLESVPVILRIGRVEVRKWLEEGSPDPIYISALAIEVRDPDEVADFECELEEVSEPILKAVLDQPWNVPTDLPVVERP